MLKYGLMMIYEIYSMIMKMRMGYDLWDLWWVKDFMKCLLNYESDMLLIAWTWKQKYDKFSSMEHEHDYV
jgi:hypothetical protein